MSATSPTCDRPGPMPVVPLSELRAGERATLHAARLRGTDRRLLHAMGLTRESEIRVCRRGCPCIIQVSTTRLAMSAAIARRIFVTPLRATG